MDTPDKLKLPGGGNNAMLSVLTRIEMLHNVTNQKLESIELNISKSIISGITNVESELKTQTGLLSGILKKLGGKVETIKKEKSEKGKAKPMNTEFGKKFDDIVTSVGDKSLISLAKVLLVLGGGFYILGKGLGEMKDISLSKVITISIMLVTLFTAIATIYQKGYNVSVIQALKVQLVSTIFAYTISSVSSILANSQTLQATKLLTAIAIAIIFVPLTLIFISTIKSIYSSKHALSFVTDIISAPVTMIASMGALVLIPMMAMVLVSVSRILATMKPVSNNILKNTLLLALVIVPITSAYIAVVSKFIAGGLLGGLIKGFVVAKSFSLIPLMAYSLKAVANILNGLPNINYNKYVVAIATALAMIPIVYIFITIFKALNGTVLSTVVRAASSIIDKKWGLGITGMFDSTRAAKSALFIIPILAGVLTLTAWIMQAMPSKFKIPPISWCLNIGISMILFAYAVKALLSSFDSSEVDINGKKQASPKLTVNNILIATAGMLALGYSILSLSYITQSLPNDQAYKSPPIKWIIGIGLALYVFAKGLGAILAIMQGGKKVMVGLGSLIKEDAWTLPPVTVSDILKAASVQAIAGASMVILAGITMGLPAAGDLVSPSLKWSFETGLALTIITISWCMINSVLSGKHTISNKFLKKQNIQVKESKLSTSKLLIIVAATLIVALSIVAIANIFKLLPTKSKTPDLSWSLKTGFAIAMFSLGLALIYSALNGNIEGGYKFLKHKKKTKLNNIKSVGFSILAMITIAFSIISIAYIFQLLPPENNFKSPPLGWIFKVSTVIALFSISIQLLSGVAHHITMSSIAKTTLIIYSIGLAIVGLAYLFQILPEENKFKSPPLFWIIKVGIAMTLFSIAIAVLIKSNLSTKNIYDGTLLLTGIGISIVAIAWIFNLLPEDFKSPTLEWVISTSLALTAFAIVFTIAGIFDKKITAGSKAMLIATLSILVLSVAIKIWVEAVPKGPEGLTVLLQMTVAITFVAVAFSVAGIFEAEIDDGASAMILASIAVLLISSSAYIFSKAITPDANGWNTIAQMSVLITNIGLAMAGAGAIFYLIIPGAAAMIFAGAALIAISEGVSKLSSIYDKSPAFFSLNGKSGPLADMMKSIVIAFSEHSLKDILKMYRTAPALIMGGYAISEIANGLYDFSKIEMDTTIIANKAAFVVSVIANAFANIGNKYSSNSIIGFIKNVSGNDPISKGVRFVRGVGKVLSEVAMGVQAWGNLTYIDNKGKRVTIPESDLIVGGRIPVAIENVLTVISNTFAKIGKLNKGNSFFGDDSVSDGIESVEGIGSILSNIARGVQDFANLKFEDENGKKWAINPKDLLFNEKDPSKSGAIISNIWSVITVLSQVFSKVGKLNAGGGLFSDNNVKEGIESIVGAGIEISNIAKAIQDAAYLKFTDKDGKIQQLTPDMLGVDGIVSTNIRLMIQSLTEPLSKLGSSKVAKSKWFGLVSSDIEKAKEIITSINEPVDACINAINKVAAISKDTITTAQSNLNELFIMFPRSFAKVGEFLNKNEDLIDKSSDFIIDYPDDIAKAVDRISKNKSAMESVANSFKIIASSMSEFKVAVNDIDTTKVESVNGVGKSITELTKFTVKNDYLSNIKTQVIEGIEEGINTTIELFNKNKGSNTLTTETVKQVQTQNSNGQVTLLDNSKLLELQLQILNTLKAINASLNGELAVKVNNNKGLNFL